MSSKIYISVLVQTYCHGPFIGECLESILGQDFQGGMEVIVGDDGSSDGTLETCLAFERSDKRVSVVRRPPDFRRIDLNGHRSGRANLLDLMHRARGEFVIRVDGDDLWNSPDKLSKQVAVLHNNPEVIATYHDTVFIDDEGRLLPERKFIDLPAELTMEDMIADVSPFHISSFLYRNIGDFRVLPELAEKVVGLDRFLFAYVAARGRVMRVPGVLSSYRVHAGGETKSGLYAGNSYHRHRIELWGRAKAHLPSRVHDRICDVREAHLFAAADFMPSAIQMLPWLRSFLYFPAFYLGTWRRFRALLRIIRRGLHKR